MLYILLSFGKIQKYTNNSTNLHLFEKFLKVQYSFFNKYIYNFFQYRMLVFQTRKLPYKISLLVYCTTINNYPQHRQLIRCNAVQYSVLASFLLNQRHLYTPTAPIHNYSTNRMKRFSINMIGTAFLIIKNHHTTIIKSWSALHLLLFLISIS